ncbi:unnamed protein product [Sphagnum balticum]
MPTQFRRTAADSRHLAKNCAITEKQRKKAEDASTELPCLVAGFFSVKGLSPGQLLDAAIVAQRVIDRAYLPPEDALISANCPHSSDQLSRRLSA